MRSTFTDKYNGSGPQIANLVEIPPAILVPPLRLMPLSPTIKKGNITAVWSMIGIGL